MEQVVVTQSQKLLEQSLIHIGNFSINAYGIAIVFIFAMLVLVAWKAHNDDDDFDLLDTVRATDPISGKTTVSATKVLQLLGGTTATFVVIKMTLQAAISWEIFATYLAYVASVEGFSKFILAKYGVKDSGTK